MTKEQLGVTVLRMDESNRNGRIYSTEVVEGMLKNIAGSKMLGTFGMDGVNLENVSHEASNLRIEDGELRCDIKVLDTPMGLVLQTMLNDVEYASRGYGRISATGEVSEWTMISVDVVSKGNKA